MGMLGDDLILERIAKARARLAGLDIAGMAVAATDKVPLDLAPAHERVERREFLRRALGDPVEADRVFERIIQGNELQDIAYFEKGLIAARSVCRVVIGGRRGNYGTGFLVAPDVLLTNNHVLPDGSVAALSRAEFNFERDRFGKDIEPVEYRLDPARLFHTDTKLDFSVVAMTPRADQPLERFGHCPLIADLGKVTEGEWLTIIQHPGGDRKQVCVRENRMLHCGPDVLWYSTDTLGGASGSPVYNNDWLVVALHHSGVPEEKDGVIQTVQGRDFVSGRDNESDIKWIANEGIRVSRIVGALRAALPDHLLLQPIFAARPESAADAFAAPLTSVPAAITPSHAIALFRKDPPMPTPPNRSVTVTLDIAEDGAVSLRNAAPHTEALLDGALERRRAASGQRPPDIDVPFVADYSDRHGFIAGFLADDADKAGDLLTPLPGLTDSSIAAPLLADEKAHVLKYHGMSIVIHKERRFALYSAASVDFANRFDMGRPSDNWRIDPRISAKHQIGEFYYRSNNFDRGHLTRREDMEYGRSDLSPAKSRIAALQSAADTCHFTNCTPQHSQFNQSKELWQGLERHLLESAIKTKGFRAQIFTGPVLEEDDPVYDRFPDIQYPVRYWKIAVARSEVNGKDQLFAAGFILDQRNVIARFGIEAVEVPFEPYKTFQVKISEIELLTGLKFGAGMNGEQRLSDFDPLEKASITPTLRRRRTRLEESTGAPTTLPEGYVPLDQLTDLIV